MSGRYEVQNYRVDQFGIWDTRNKTWWQEWHFDGPHTFLANFRSNAHLIAGALNAEDKPAKPITITLCMYDKLGNVIKSVPVATPPETDHYAVTISGGPPGEHIPITGES